MEAKLAPLREQMAKRNALRSTLNEPEGSTGSKLLRSAKNFSDRHVALAEGY
jgi:hypothetical protein